MGVATWRPSFTDQDLQSPEMIRGLNSSLHDHGVILFWRIEDYNIVFRARIKSATCINLMFSFLTVI